MSKKTITMIAALGAVLLLAGGYYWSLNRKGGDAPSYQPYTPPPTLGNLLASDIVKIEGPGITLEKNDDVWEITRFEEGIPPGGIDLDQQRLASMTYSFANVWTELLIDEAPGDLSVFGLDEPSTRLTVTDKSGRKVEYVLGNLTPSMMSYYIMQEGDPAVYTIASYLGSYMQLSMEDIRQVYEIPQIQPEEMKHFVIDSPDRRIEVIKRPETLPPYLASSYSPYFLASPYQLARGTHTENLSNLLAGLTYLTVMEFVDDNPASLAPYGLDNPVRVYFQGESASLDLLLGNEAGGLRYAKFPGSSAVFAVYGADDFVNVNPFSLIDKFALLVNIQAIDGFTVRGEGRELNADVNDRGEEGVFVVNGRRAEDKSFRAYYQAVIGLLMDAEYHAAPGIALELNGEGNVTVEYRLFDPPGERVSITLIPYNRDFYVLRQEGTMEFLISRNQVRRIYETADSLAFLE